MLLEIDVRLAGPLLLESLPSEAQDPEVYPVIEQTDPETRTRHVDREGELGHAFRATFQAVEDERAKELNAQASVWLEKTKRGRPKLRDLIRERPAEKDTKLANALAEGFNAFFPQPGWPSTKISCLFSGKRGRRRSRCLARLLLADGLKVISYRMGTSERLLVCLKLELPKYR